MAGCGCTLAYGNTGLPNFRVIEGVTNSFIMMPTYKGDGTRNFIDLSSPTLAQDIKDMTQASTAAVERLYPLPKMENVTKEKTETVFETSPSNKKFRIRDGVRTNRGEFWDDNAPFQFMKELQGFGCHEMSYLRVDICGNLIGYKESKDATEFYPIPMDSASYDTMMIFATDTTVQKLALEFEMEANFDESSFWILTSTELGFNATTLRGLVTGNAVISNITATSVDVTLTECYGTALTLNEIIGLLPANFALFNETDALAVAIVTATEIADGVYTLTFAAQAAADVIRVTVTATNYEVAPVTFVAV